MTIREAKRNLTERYRHEDGFVGVGISHRYNEETLRVYVVDPHAPIVKHLPQDGQFQGFPIEIEVSGKIQAL